MLRNFPFHVAKDFTYPLWAARALLAGRNPYHVRYPFPEPLFYPLPAAVVTTPFALFPTALAAALFAACSVGLLAWVLVGQGVWRLWLLLSTPFLFALTLVQWSPALIGATFLPVLGAVLAAKPTLGAVLFLWRPSWRAFWSGALVVVVSFALVPRWPLDWWAAVHRTPNHYVPLLRPFGWLTLVALLRWRSADARLVTLMACVPQNVYFYDQLPLALVAWNGRSALALTALSWVAYAGMKAHCTDRFFCGPQAEPWVMWCVFLPAAVLVLLRDRWLAGQVRRVWAATHGWRVRAKITPDAGRA